MRLLWRENCALFWFSRAHHTVCILYISGNNVWPSLFHILTTHIVMSLRSILFLVMCGGTSVERYVQVSKDAPGGQKTMSNTLGLKLREVVPCPSQLLGTKKTAELLLQSHLPLILLMVKACATSPELPLVFLMHVKWYLLLVLFAFPLY